MRLFLLFATLLSVTIVSASTRDTLDLAGNWLYRLTGAPSSIPGEGQINLPSTLDAAHKTVYTPESDNTTQLRHEFSFAGEASYSKRVNIPASWAGKNIELVIERTKPSSVSIDGRKVGSDSRISSPQNYDLSEFLTPGNHLIEISVNNADSIPPIIARSSHAVSESTQTNWNGILGEFLLTAKNPFHVNNVAVNDKLLPRDVSVSLSFSERAPSGLTVTAYLNGRKISTQKIKTGSASLEFLVPVKKADLWSASNPVLHDLSFIVKDSGGKVIDDYSLKTGFRKFSAGDDYFKVNDNPVFLRGTVNAAVFPLTGFPPLDKDSWLDYFNILKEYGLNHVRFHSWTPPEAAFSAADEAGIYILTELPLWGELDRDLVFHNRFLEKDLRGIMANYSRHPSFVMFSTGNELWGDINLMGEYMKEAKALNPRILATYGSNFYLGMNGQIGDEDFMLAAKTGDDASKSVRGSVSFADSSTGGFFNSTYPGASFNFEEATRGVTVPVISHEVGQYQSYPDFSEIEKYTGNLKPDNLKEFKKRAEEAGTYSKNKRFAEASGKWAAKLYKAEMELAQRSPGIAGFELFGIQDYPGQGTALVGILDPFMESKGFISPEDWNSSSSDVVILAEFPKYSFYEGESVEIPVLTVNFSDKPDSIGRILWSTDFSQGEILSSPGTGVTENRPISLRMPKIDEPKKFTLNLRDDKSRVSNSYDFWVYPEKLPDVKNVFVTDNLTEALILLDQGSKVILCPDSATVAKASLDPLFTPDFWNYRMYRSICDEMNLTPSPGTLGLLVNNEHPAMRKFPSDIHTDWQWYPIVANSRPLIIDRLPKNFDPIVEVIDNVERNFRLSLLLECNVGKGKLMILSTDIDKASRYPEGRWFLQSVKEYMAGKEFRPDVTLSPDQLVNLVTKPSRARLVKDLKNETYRKF